MKMFRYLLVVILTTQIVLGAYPDIVSDSDTNHTANKELVYSIPVEYYKSVDTIIFENNLIAESTWLHGGYGKLAAWGFTEALWDDKYHYCYQGTVWIDATNDYNIQFVLLHELGHIHDFCEVKSNISTEQYANNYAEKYLTQNAETFI